MNGFLLLLLFVSLLGLYPGVCKPFFLALLSVQSWQAKTKTSTSLLSISLYYVSLHTMYLVYHTMYTSISLYYVDVKRHIKAGFEKKFELLIHAENNELQEH